MIPLGELADINPRSTSLDGDEAISFVGMAELDDRIGVAVPRETRAFSEVAKGYTVFNDGDILAAKITPCWENGKIGVAQLDHPVGVGSTEFHVVRARPAIDKRYLLHFLRQDSVRDAGELRMTGSGGQRRVPRQFLESLAVPVPNIEEQQRIAAILDQVDAIRALHVNRQELVDDLAQESFALAAMDARTSWMTLKELDVRFIAGASIVGNATNVHPINRVLKVSAVSGGQFAPAESKALPWDYSPPTSHAVSNGDVLFARASGSLRLVGSVAVASRTPPGLFLPDKIWRVVVPAGSPVSALYIAAALRSPDSRRYIEHHASGAAGVRNISMAKVLRLSVPVTPPERRKAHEQLVRRLADERTIHEREGADLDALFASLQSRAFRGEL